MRFDKGIWDGTKETVMEFMVPYIEHYATSHNMTIEATAKIFSDTIDERPKNLSYFSFSFYGNIADYGWVAYYEFFIKSKIIETTDNFEKMKDLLMSGIYDQIQLEEVCIICEHPEYVHWDDQGRLHCQDGYSIKWADQFALTTWHGIVVPAKVIFFPEEVTKEDLQNETNAEIRRCYQEKLGDERFAELLDTKCIDESTDLSGRPLLLMRTKEKDPVAEDYINFVVVTDHSTPRKYWISVPPEFKSAREALAWTADESSWESYSQLRKET